MSNLLNTDEGRNAVIVAQRFLLQRRLSRFFKHNLVIDVDRWSRGVAEFDLSTLLGDLNPDEDDGILDLYRLLGTIGGLPTSIADTSIYVDGTNGNDITGTGSVDRPYATLWFLNFLPQRINHIYRILILNTVTQSENIILTNDFGPGGCLSFIGVGVETEMYAALAGTISAAPVSMYNAGLQLQTSVDPTSPVHNTFIQYTSGGQDTKAMPVDQVWPSAFGMGWQGVLTKRSVFMPANGDGYRYIVPTPTIDFDDQIGITVACHGFENLPETFTFRKSCVNFANLNMIFDNSTGCDSKLIVDSDVDVGFWFARAVMPNGNDAVVRFRSRINTSNPVDDGIPALTLSTVSNIEKNPAGPTPDSCGFLICSGSVNNYSSAMYPIVSAEKNAEIHTVTCVGRWAIRNASIRTYQVSTLSVESYESQCNFLSTNFWNYLSAPIELLITRLSDIYLTNICFGYTNSSNLIGAISTRFIQGTSVGSNSAITGVFNFVVTLSGLCGYFLAAAWAGSASGFADCAFMNTAVPTTGNFPAVSTNINDTLGQNVTRGTV